MSELDSADAEPALLTIDGAIATITLNRPNAFNSINLSIAQKLEQLSAELLARYCELGVTASRTVYPGTDHVSVIAAAYADVGAYLQARLAGEPAPSSC